jgi:hypothetical protein
MVPTQVVEGRCSRVYINVDARVAVRRPADLSAARKHVCEEPGRVLFSGLDFGDFGRGGVEDAKAVGEDCVAEEGGVFGWGAGEAGIFC